MPSDTEDNETTTSAYVPSQQEIENHPRMLAMAAIRVKREDDDEPGSTGGADDQLALQTEQAPRLLTDGLDKTMVRVKVDGVEQDIPVADVVRSYQKDAAAQARLNEATRVLEEARRTAAATAKPPARVEQEDDAGDTPSATKPETVKEFVEALFEGDTDKAVEAFAKLGLNTGRSSGATLNLEQVQAQLTPAIKQQLIDDSALERFEKANADLAADPHLVSVTNGFIQEAVNGGTSYADALEAGAKRTRDWLASIGAAKPAPEPAPSAHQPSKLERKARIDEVQALNRTANTTQDAPASTSSVIAEMKKARGQG
jgi:hypothetical protein